MIMTKYFKVGFAAIALSLSTLNFVACGDDDDSPSTQQPTNPVDPVTPDKDDAMSADEQKEYMQQVAQEFMNLTPASDFKDMAELGKYIDKTYLRKYEWDDVGEWAKNIFKASRESLGDTEKRTSWGSYVYHNYKALLIASNFYSHFTANNGRWIREDADDLQFIFTEQRGLPCVLKLVTSGNTKDLVLVNFKDHVGDDYDYNTHSYIDYYDKTKCTIRVPENIELSLTVAGSPVLKTTVKIDLSSVTPDEFNLAEDNLVVSTSVDLANGYKADVSNVTYQANAKVIAQATVSKNGTSLVTVSVSSDISGIPSVNVSAFTDSDFDPDDYNTDKANAKNAFAKIDVLGKIQVQGKCSDVRKFADYLKKADDANEEESEFKSYINQANGLIDFNLFYNNSAVKQATIKLEPFQKSSWNRTKWEFEPIMVFFDGSSYSTFKAFFNSDDFESVINQFEDLLDDYKDLVDK